MGYSLCASAYVLMENIACFPYGVMGDFPDVFFGGESGIFSDMLFKWVLWYIVVCGGALLWGYMVDGGVMVVLLCMNIHYLCIFMHYFAYFMYVFG